MQGFHELLLPEEIARWKSCCCRQASIFRRVSRLRIGFYEDKTLLTTTFLCDSTISVCAWISSESCGKANCQLWKLQTYMRKRRVRQAFPEKWRSPTGLLEKWFTETARNWIRFFPPLGEWSAPTVSHGRPSFGGPLGV